MVNGGKLIGAKGECSLARGNSLEIGLRMAARKAENDRPQAQRRRSCMSGKEKALKQEKPKNNIRGVGALYLEGPKT